MVKENEAWLCGQCGLNLDEHTRDGEGAAHCHDMRLYVPRRGDWMQTCSGARFWFLDPQPEEIVFDDIAVGLANLCRYTGQVRSFYSVAQHSVFVSELVQALGGEPKLQRAALLHDASEAYLSDLPRPLKYLLTEYRVIEKDVERVIEAAFAIELTDAERALLKLADRMALQLERRALFADELRWAGDGEYAQYAKQLNRWRRWPERTEPPMVAYASFVANWNVQAIRTVR